MSGATPQGASSIPGIPGALPGNTGNQLGTAPPMNLQAMQQLLAGFHANPPPVAPQNGAWQGQLPPWAQANTGHGGTVYYKPQTPQMPSPGQSQISPDMIQKFMGILGGLR